MLVIMMGLRVKNKIMSLRLLLHDKLKDDGKACISYWTSRLTAASQIVFM